MKNLKIGDHVKVQPLGYTGVIICQGCMPSIFGVRMDLPNSRIYHTLGGRVEADHGYWYPEEELSLFAVEPKDIIPGDIVYYVPGREICVAGSKYAMALLPKIVNRGKSFPLSVRSEWIILSRGIPVSQRPDFLSRIFPKTENKEPVNEK